MITPLIPTKAGAGSLEGTLKGIPTIPTPSGGLSNFRVALRAALNEAGRRRAQSRFEQIQPIAEGLPPGSLGGVANLIRQGIRGPIETVFGDVMKERQTVADFALKLMAAYPDANILSSDSPESAARKASLSPSFTRKETGTKFISGAFEFSRDEFQTGAVNAGVGLDDFKGFSPEGHNFFINGFARIQDRQQIIDNSLETGSVMPGQIAVSINDSSLPDEVKRHLIRHLRARAAEFGIDVSDIKEPVPEWFREQMEEAAQMSIHPDELQRLWDSAQE
ncbi:MAG TPA: hypothetical protein ENI04_00870 [Candidatus Wildermuthbacteria bacterium]|nr:hypothetical protein [Candidatus Wildermuthbacteria bacterium]